MRMRGRPRNRGRRQSGSVSTAVAAAVLAADNLTPTVSDTVTFTLRWLGGPASATIAGGVTADGQSPPGQTTPYIYAVAGFAPEDGPSDVVGTVTANGVVLTSNTVTITPHL